MAWLNHEILNVASLEHVCSHNSYTNDTLNRHEGVIAGGIDHSMQDEYTHSQCTRAVRTTSVDAVDVWYVDAARGKISARLRR